LGDELGIVITLVLVGWSHLYLGNYNEAAPPLEEALSLARKLAVPNRVALALTALGEVRLRQGRYDEALPLLEESLVIRRDMGHRVYIATILGAIALAAIRQKDYHRAAQKLVESLSIRKAIGDKGGVAWCLEKFGQLESAMGQKGDAVRVARLLGAAEALREILGTTVDMVDQAEHYEAITIARNRLGEEAFTTAWQEGRAMNMEQAIRSALEDDA
jgi:tetratricopeptide (TPR) repeat protein